MERKGAHDSRCQQLGAAGEAFFMTEVQEFVEEEEYRTSPLASPVQHTPEAVGADQLAPLDLDTQELTAPAATEPTDADINGTPQPEWHDSYRFVGVQ